MKDHKCGRSKKCSLWVNLALVVVVVGLAIAPLLMLEDAEFSGADGKAEGQIAEIDPNYVPWFEPLLEPASGEIESMLFALQAAFGSGVLFYGLGYLKGKKKQEVGE